MNQKKLANLGLFAAVAIIFGYVESLIPFFAGIPGMKLGLANLAVLFILEKYTWKEAALVSVIRIFIIGFMFGNLFSILYSLAGAALSLTVMTVMKKKSDFSILGISVAGGVSHNIGQLLIACLITMTSGLIYPSPCVTILHTFRIPRIPKKNPRHLRYLAEASRTAVAFLLRKIMESGLPKKIRIRPALKP